MSLYQKYRPQTWEEVCGQTYVTKTLQNQIDSEDVGHAYLFIGTRGIGKTTIARIFGRKVNEKYLPEGYDANNNIIEMDGASNNSVEDVRKIRMDVNHKPSIGKYKVFLIDETHMLSASAFNALLKTLEEPPEHIIFCLATTEAHKLPATILSRCQRYDLQRFDTKQIYDRLKYIVDCESIGIEESALKHIAKLGKGSMRDAISILDQVRSFKENLTFKDLLDIFGNVGIDVLEKVMDNLKNPGELMKILKEIYFSGTDMKRFVLDLYNYGNDCMLINKLGKEGMDYTSVSDDYYEGLVKNGVRIKFAFLESLQQLLTDLKYSDSEYQLIQNTLLKLGAGDAT
jgi:DNA polymerase-3 subunit gamma/tau